MNRETIISCHDGECAYCSQKPSKVVATNQYKPKIQSYELCGSDFIPLCDEDLREYVKTAKMRAAANKVPLKVWEMLEGGLIVDLSI